MNSLISVMLVDDEPLALDNVYQMVPWAENGFQVVAKATSGRMALRMFEELQPQIVITDISMSPMDGLELGRLVVQLAPKTRLIFLTAYRDFDYARQALEMRAAHYLLKHEISRNRLLEQLKLLKEGLAADAAEEDGHGHALHILLKDMLAGKYQAPTGNQESRLHRLVTEHQRGQPALLYFELGAAILLDGSRRNKRWPASIMWKNIEEEIRIQSTDIEEIHVLEMDEGGYIILLKLSSSSSLLLQHYNLRQIAAQVLVSLKAYCEGVLPRMIISAGSGAELPDRRYAAIRQAYDYSMFLPPGAVFLLEQALSAGDDSIIANEVRQYLLSPEKSKLDSLKVSLEKVAAQARLGDMRAVIGEIGDECRKDGSCSTDLDLGTDARQIISSIYRILEERLQRRQLKNNYSRWVNKAMDYVVGNYADPDLSLETVAGHLQISSIHLRTTFKRETGQSLLDYTTEYRVALAKQLLQTGEFKIYEVSEKVGYKTSQYFSQVFKKTTGIQPKDFLQQKGGE
ncbi:response regulator [Paenibacillus sp. 19GGS1-52]|uniref:response regulator transcription factor n=1 Tax=Paenibacillus sp. 19GGS1-52 TaxID=2758563 RepID=UPI001EFC0C10|nr:response regulator [Paenibacillus sp. 19GGS1-52]ULO05247.1 response regulator [Paenibacillus sp. 19GGS1-52]